MCPASTTFSHQYVSPKGWKFNRIRIRPSATCTRIKHISSSSTGISCRLFFNMQVIFRTRTSWAITRISQTFLGSRPLQDKTRARAFFRNNFLPNIINCYNTLNILCRKFELNVVPLTHIPSSRFFPGFWLRTSHKL